MKTSYIDERSLPLIIEPDVNEESCGFDALNALCRTQRASLHERLRESGALLFRGFGRRSAEEFEQFVHLFSGGELWDYVGGASPRVKLSAGGVYTSTEYPAHYTLSLHNELSYSYRWPRHLYFCCVTPAAEGGQTPIADSRQLLMHLDSEVVGEFRERGVRYVRNLHGGTGVGLSWQAAFETAERGVVEDYCRAGNVSFEWKEDGGLRMCQTRPATLAHPETGAEVWFNQADGFHPSGMDRAIYEMLSQTVAEEDFPLYVTFGDGAQIPLSHLEHIRAVMWQQAVIFQWQAGDILVLDNILAAHGRMPFSGERKILLAMT